MDEPADDASRCDNCGDLSGAHDLSEVRRIYLGLDPEHPDVTECAEDELWCSSCTAVYPHRPLT